MHYDQETLYDLFTAFQKNHDGVEVTRNDLLEAWDKACGDTGYTEHFKQLAE